MRVAELDFDGSAADAAVTVMLPTAAGHGEGAMYSIGAPLDDEPAETVPHGAEGQETAHVTLLLLSA